MREILAKRLTGPLRWYGGKQRLAPKLVPLIPEHQTYIEVFAGGLGLLFAKDTSPLEVVNDLDSGIVNFYRVLRDKGKFEEFHRQISLTPFAREEYLNCQATWMTCEDDVEKARRWFTVVRQCFTGRFASGFGISVTAGRHGMATNVAGYLSAINRLPEISERLRRVQIEGKDFREIIKSYDQPKAFFYLDPPYIADTRKAKKVYMHEMTNRDHEDLVELLLGIEGKAILSGYDHPIYGPLECAGWKKHEFEAHCAAAARTTRTGLLGKGAATEKHDRTECVWVRT